ncbi:DNA-binding response regulator [Sporosarcina sp. NCCP-2716]|uniref:response regulator transcription factor n=1 Tax=Sporosarcina sp. NCCP-2716 TaxID=2943679 RepID=UPI002042508D|nr:DNA-binding response regulator [Sporosarcina sp. NCCP-2716]GKV70568.1 DNA-binding response regulator [Sporosarcina sp. NCCP-2716]
MHILLVDDEPLELEQLEHLLKPRFPHWSFCKATDAASALSAAKSQKISLAFLDIHMPGMDGLTLAAELKALYDLDIIMVTAFQSFDYAQRSIRLGVDDYLTKPVIEAELLATLQKYEKWNAKSDTIQQVLRIIHTDYAEKLSLSSIASEIHMSPTYLSRKFLEEMGIGFADYVTDFRMDIAKQLLVQEPDATISAVAERAGFNSQHYFSSLFRKNTGMTPSAYRQQITVRPGG